MIKSTQLDGVALVVGAGRGIGKESTFSLAEAGVAAIVFADVNEAWAKTAAEESKKYAANTNYQTSVIYVDVRDEKSVQSMIDFVVKKYGRVDYCVNSAGIGNDKHVPFADTKLDVFDEVMNVNTRGQFLCVRAQAAAMRKQSPKTWTSRSGIRDIGRGAIINLGSANSFVGLPGKGSYTVSKHACVGVTKMAGLDHSPEGIRVIAVCPTWVRTPLVEEEIRKNPEVKDLISAVIPIKRIAEGEEVSDVIAFLCSPAASYINGTSILIDAAATTTAHLF